MLSLDPAKLGELIDRGVEFRQKHTSRRKEIEKHLAGRWYRNDHSCEPQPENLIFAYCAFMLPELAFNAPLFRVEAKQPISHEDVADAMQSAVEAWIRESDFRDEHQAVVLDALLGWGVMKVGLEEIEQGGMRGSLRPYACRIPPDQFVMDPTASDWKHARWMAHEYYRDIEDLRNDPRFDAEAVEELSAYQDDKNKTSERAVGREINENAGMVKLVDMWIPEHGVICTIAMQGDSASRKFLKKPTKYWGPDTGPYQVFGFYRIPGDPYPIGPVQSVMDQYEEIRMHLTVAGEEAASAKSFWLVDASRPDVGSAMVNAKTGDVIPVKDLKDSTVKVETGTMSNQRLEYIQTRLDSFDRTIGFGDAQRGKNTNSTAKEAEITQGNTDVRTEWLRSRCNENTAEVARKVCWYLFYDPSVVMPVTMTDQATGAVEEGTFLGGPQQGQDMDWVDFNLEIDPQSMQKSDDAVIQQRYMQLVQLAPTLVQLQSMGINSRWLTDRLGSTMNQPNLSKILFAPNVAGMMQPMGMSGMIPPHLQQIGQPGVVPPNQQPVGLPTNGIPPVNANLEGQSPAFL